MIQKNLLPYDEISFRDQFIHTDMYKQIEKDADQVVWEKFFTHWLTSPSKEITPRCKASSSIVSLTSFYYLQFLLEKNPNQIVDLGCGDNWFKKYIPCIWGIDGLRPSSPHYRADQHITINDYWIKQNKNRFDYMMSINALHFRPLETLRETTLNVMSMLRRGRGYIAFNIMRFVEKSEIGLFSDLLNNYSNRPTHEVTEWAERVPRLEEYIRQELYGLPFNILVFDLDLTYLEEGLDGNLRIVFER